MRQAECAVGKSCCQCRPGNSRCRNVFHALLSLQRVVDARISRDDSGGPGRGVRRVRSGQQELRRADAGRARRRPCPGARAGRHRQRLLGRPRHGDRRRSARVRRGAARADRHRPARARAGRHARRQRFPSRHADRVRRRHHLLVWHLRLQRGAPLWGASRDDGGLLRSREVPGPARTASGAAGQPGVGPDCRRGADRRRVRNARHACGHRPRIRQARHDQGRRGLVGGGRAAAADAGGRRSGDERRLQRADLQCAGERGPAVRHRLGRSGARCWPDGHCRRDAELRRGAHVRPIRNDRPVDVAAGTVHLVQPDPALGGAACHLSLRYRRRDVPAHAGDAGAPEARAAACCSAIPWRT